MMKWKKGLFLFLAVSMISCWIDAHTGDCAEKEFVNCIGMKFILIPAGSFVMGCDEAVEACALGELPRHEVTISKPFYMGVYEVTQGDWEAIMDYNPSQHKGTKHPVDSVSWEDAQDFIRRLNKKEGAEIFRLPTEAEWEYAARAGTKTAFSFGDDEADLPDYAWYGDLPDMDGTLPVGLKKPNPWGLYDIHGNIDEWTLDWLDENYYAASPKVDPPGGSSGVYRVLRGGSWAALPWHCRSAVRNRLRPEQRMQYFGLRLVADIAGAGSL